MPGTLRSHLVAALQAWSGSDLGGLRRMEATEALAAGVAPARQAPGRPRAATPGRALCLLYEALQADGARRRRGAFYTPPDLARLVADLALCDPGPALDPACGGGMFLLEIAERLGPYAAYGMDLDPDAVAVARAALWLDHRSAPDADLPGVAGRVAVRDAITEAAPWPLRFATVLGNPPYGPLHGDAARPFRHLFGRVRPNTFGAFLARAPAWARPGGRVGLVLPRSLARVAAYAPLRAWLAEAGAVERIVDVGQATAGVGYEQLVVVLCAGARAGETALAAWRPGAGLTERLRAPQDRLVRPAGVPLSLDREGLGLVRRLEGAGPALGDVAEVFRGLGESARGPAVRTVEGDGGTPVLRGADVWRFEVRGCAWLDADRAASGRGAARAGRMDRPRIVAPNVVSSRIRANAAWEAHGRPALDTVTNIVVDPALADPFAVLGALNSSVGTWLLRYPIFGAARLTNHLDAAYVGRLPLPPAGPATARLAALARDRRRDGDPEGDTALDAAAFAAYGLDAGDAALVLSGVRE